MFAPQHGWPAVLGRIRFPNVTWIGTRIRCLDEAACAEGSIG